MIKKRLIGVVTIKNGWAVQSFGYSRYLPLGKPELLVENLDRWGVDEILIQVIDRSICNSGPDFELVNRLANLGLKTPLIYSGGIKSDSEGIRLIKSGADRIVVDSLLRRSIDVVKKLSLTLGAQALITSLPVSSKNGTLLWYDYIDKKFSPLSDELNSLIRSDLISEILLIDWENEGVVRAFNQDLINHLPNNIPLILFGGISESCQIQSLLGLPNVAAVAIGNFLTYKEHAIQTFKNELHGISIRPANYESNFSLIN